MDLSQFIEHTLLRPNTSKKDVLSLCTQADKHNFWGVCIPPYYVSVARKAISDAGTDTKIATVIGFPFGYGRTSAKVEEVKQALRDGVDEIDAVINIAAVKSNDFTTVSNDIDSMITACQMQNKKAKLIFEVDLLNDKEITKLCMLAVEAGADFIKTSTGMLPGGVTTEIISKLRKQLPEKVLIKAAGGIKTAKQAQELIAAGAARIGTSNGLKIIGNK